MKFVNIKISQFIWFFALATLAASADSSISSISNDDLLSGEAIFSKRIDISTLPDPRILETDETMRAFVAKKVDGANSGRERIRRLLSGMIESGLLSLDYNAVETKTAKQTFYDRIGNCLSFTNLLVALGREAGLDVVYQIVDIPPTWYLESDLVILNTHINVAVNSNYDDRTVVDFNTAEFRGNYDSHEVADEYAFALFHSNVAMEALTEGDIETSFLYLKKSISLDSKNAIPWINLGVLYSRRDMPDFAIAAYKRALKIDSKNRSALSNLAHLYQSLGNTKMADRYLKKIKRYQKKNPYFHFYQARLALESGQIEEAQKNVEQAIRLKEAEHQFHALLGVIYYKRGNTEAAIEQFARAKELAEIQSAEQIYDQKLSLLTAM